MMKRAFGAVSMLLMLHLSLVRADSACASHGASKGSPMAGMAEHHHGPAGPSHGGQKEKCDTPVTQDCCSALTSCAPALAAPASVEPRFAVLRVRQSTDRVESAPSRVTAPETPPPRA